MPQKQIQSNWLALVSFASIENWIMWTWRSNLSYTNLNMHQNMLHKNVFKAMHFCVRDVLYNKRVAFTKQFKEKTSAKCIDVWNSILLSIGHTLLEQFYWDSDIEKLLLDYRLCPWTPCFWMKKKMFQRNALAVTLLFYCALIVDWV